VIARTGVGYDAVDVAAATARGIPVTITPGTNQESVAEQTFALLLALTRDVTFHDRSIRSGGWQRTLSPRPLRGRTIGLVGLGRIGRAVASKAIAFGMRVLACEPLGDPEADRRLGIERVGLDELLANSDIISLHLPLLESTRGLLDRAAFARMKPGSLLINTSRGGLIVEDDLIEALRSGQLAGAGLDVFDREPPAADNPLRSMPNVVATPHMGGIDTLAMGDMATMAARSIVDLFEGRWPAEAVVNPEVAPAWIR
jgi:phosphoglycerate dehydrogenase-like enzyme